MTISSYTSYDEGGHSVRLSERIKPCSTLVSGDVSCLTHGCTDQLMAIHTVCADETRATPSACYTDGTPLTCSRRWASCSSIEVCPSTSARIMVPSSMPRLSRSGLNAWRSRRSLPSWVVSRRLATSRRSTASSRMNYSTAKSSLPLKKLRCSSPIGDSITTTSGRTAPLTYRPSAPEAVLPPDLLGSLAATPGRASIACAKSSVRLIRERRLLPGDSPFSTRLALG